MATLVMNESRPSPFFFAAILLSCIIVNANGKNARGLGMRLESVLTVITDSGHVVGDLLK